MCVLIAVNMPRRITIHPHLSIEELETRYRQAKDALRSDSLPSHLASG